MLTFSMLLSLQANHVIISTSWLESDEERPLSNKINMFVLIHSLSILKLQSALQLNHTEINLIIDVLLKHAHRSAYITDHIIMDRFNVRFLDTILGAKRKAISHSCLPYNTITVTHFINN